MSRFDRGRWHRILVWTGASLAWGTAFVTARADASGSTGSGQPSEGQVASVSPQPGMPALPAQGLVILRFTPVEAPEPEVLTVRVGRSVASSPALAVPAAQAPAVAQPAPQPSSSGS